MPSLLLLEGFELHGTAYNFDTYFKKQAYMGAAKVEDGDDPTLNGSVGDYIGATDVDSRINGQQSWMVRRADATGINQTNWARLHFDMAPKRRVCVGFAFKCNQVPTAAFPLLAFNLATELENEEQLGIWVSPTGGIFAGDENMVPDATTQLGPTPIPSSLSSSKEVVHTEWNYIEVDLNLVTSVPQLLVKVNNRIVVDFVQDAAFQKLPTDRITNFALIAPPLEYFSGASASDFFFDDLYVQVSEEAEADMTLGPQNIIGLPHLGRIAGDNILDDSPPTQFTGPALGASQNSFGAFEKAYYEITDPDSNLPSVSGVCAMGIATPISGLTELTIGVGDHVALADQRFTQAAGGNAGPATARFTTNNPPGDLELTGVGLADLAVTLSLTSQG